MGLPSAEPEGEQRGRATDPDLRLALARRLDWRFLLPSPELGRVALLGPCDPELERALASLHPAPALLDVDSRYPASGRAFAGIVTRETSHAALERAAQQLRPGGWVYVEAGRELGSCSASVLAKTLARAGFVAIRTHWHWPNVARPLEIVPLAEPSAVQLAFSRRRSGRAARAKAAFGSALSSLGLLPRFAPAVSAIARRPGAPPEPSSALGFLEARRSRLGLDALGLGAPLGQVLVTPRFRASSHVVHLILAAGDPSPRIVLKVPRLADGDGCLAREAASLVEVANRTRGRTALPRLLVFERWQGRSILAQTALPGRVLDRASARRSPERWCGAALGWLEAIDDPAARTLDAPALERLVDAPLDSLTGSLRASDVERAALAETRASAATLAGLGMRSVIEHGDLSPPNVLRDPQGGLAVLDWELAEMEGLPGCDLFFFLAFVAFARKKAVRTPDCVAAFEGAFFGGDAWALPWVRRYADAHRIPTRALTPLFLATWARCVWRIAQRLSAVGDGPFSDETCAWLRANRYYALWRHALARRDALAWEIARRGDSA